jgi:hypothetical protein
MMSKQKVSLAVVHCITVKFLTSELAEILTKLTAQFNDETHSRTQVYDWSKSFKEGHPDNGGNMDL